MWIEISNIITTLREIEPQSHLYVLNIYDRPPTSSWWSIPFATIIQIILSIGIPLLIFRLGSRSSINKEKKKEYSRLRTLTSYYILWLKSVLKVSNVYIQNYRGYVYGLGKLDYLSGVTYKHVDLSMGKLSAINNQDLYKIFMELIDQSTFNGSDNLIQITRKIEYIDSATKEMQKNHKNFIDYSTELRKDWNKQMLILHNRKHTLITTIFQDRIMTKEFAHLVNLEFNQWYKKPENNSLKNTYNFLQIIEPIAQRYYGENPTDEIVSGMLEAIQDLKLTYRMFKGYQHEIFLTARSYYNSLEVTIKEIEELITMLENATFTEWKDIKSF